MAWPFTPRANTVFRVVAFLALATPLGGVGLLLLLARSPLMRETFAPVAQPIQFDHRHHAGDEAIDCRYCHSTVEVSPSAGYPSVSTCLNCHSQIWNASPLLEPVRELYFANLPIPWNRVHDLPDFVYFNHSIHVNKGVGCVTCHGRVDLMPAIQKVQPLTMAWCLDCHRDPVPHLRPLEHIELPPGATEPPRGMERRLFLQWLGATAALAGTVACKPPPEKVMPYTRQPPEVTPGLPSEYATALPVEGYATGLVVRSYEGRPTKVEGNPDHPASLGAASAFAQALLRDLYEPSRAKVVRSRGNPRAWRAWQLEQAGRARRLEERGGEGLWFLGEPTSSPTLRSLRERIQARFPRARRLHWLPVSRDNVYAGARLAFGRALETRARYRDARVVLSLDSDFLAEGPFFLRESREFIEARQPGPEMNRLYVVESHFSVTGMNADHRIRLRPEEVERFALAVLGRLARDAALPALERFRGLELAWPEQERLVRAVAADLARHGGRAVVVVGPRQPPRVHAVAHALNAALGGMGRSVLHHEPMLDGLEAGPGSLRELAEAARQGQVDTLVMTAFNPVYTAPADVALAAVLGQVPSSTYLGASECRSR